MLPTNYKGKFISNVVQLALNIYSGTPTGDPLVVSPTVIIILSVIAFLFTAIPDVIDFFHVARRTDALPRNRIDRDDAAAAARYLALPERYE